MAAGGGSPADLTLSRSAGVFRTRPPISFPRKRTAQKRLEPESTSPLPRKRLQTPPSATRRHSAENPVEVQVLSSA